MLTKSRGAVAAGVLAVAVAGGAVAVRTLSPGHPNVSPAAYPAAGAVSGPAGSAATAALPGPPGAGGGSPDGSAGGAGRAAGTASGAAAGGRVTAGQVPPGAGGDGAVPGAGPALRALAAARAATDALPHSPRLLRELGGAAPAATPSPSGTASGSPAPTASPSASPTASGTPAPTKTPTPTPTGGGPVTVAGVDVASYQHKKTVQYPNGAPISWPQVAAAGYRFAAVKATEGEYYVNPWEASDLTAAKAAGLYVTAYHFAIPNGGDGAAQARFAAASTGYATGPRMLPLMLDIEYDPYVASDHTNECYGLSRTAMTAWLTAFVSTARQLTGQYPVIYTTADWWNTCTGGSTAFGADPMWVAAYGFASPPMPAGWPAWTYWQYTSGGTVPGVPTSGATDLSRFNVNLPGLVNPGGQASRPGARVSLRIPALAAMAGTPLTYTVSGLPSGLWISPGGLITGMVGGGGSARQTVTYHVTVSATAAGGGGGTVTFPWQVSATCGAYLTQGICPGGT